MQDHLGCAGCGYQGCPDCRIHGDDGAYRLGVLPLVLLAAPAIARAFRRRPGAPRGGLFRPRAQAPQTPAAAPAAPPSPQPAPPAHPQTLLTTVRQIIDAQPVDDEEDDFGGTMPYPAPQAVGAWRPFRRPRRLRRCPQPDGNVAVVDEETQEVLGYEAPQPMAPQQYMGGWDEFGDDEFGDDEFGDDELGDDDDDDDALGYADDAIGAADAYGDVDAIGAADSKLDRRIRHVEQQIDKLKDKALNMRGVFQRKRKAALAKRISRLQRRLRKLKDKRGDLRQADRKVRQAATSAAAGAGAGAAAAMLAAQGLGGPPVWNTRTALNAPSQRIANPAQLAQLRRMQAADGLRLNAIAPPGSGRLTNIQMYADVDVGNPRNALTVPVAGITASTTLRTRNLPYATTTIVGFQAKLFGTDAANNAIGLVRDLMIEGGTNLFLSSGWLEASLFSDSEALQGLRANPQLQTTNNAQVDVAAAGDTDDVVCLVCSVVVDIVADDTYGLGVPGVYAG